VIGSLFGDFHGWSVSDWFLKIWSVPDWLKQSSGLSAIGQFSKTDQTIQKFPQKIEIFDVERQFRDPSGGIRP